MRRVGYEEFIGHEREENNFKIKCLKTRKILMTMVVWKIQVREKCKKAAFGRERSLCTYVF